MQKHKEEEAGAAYVSLEQRDHNAVVLENRNLARAYALKYHRKFRWIACEDFEQAAMIGLFEASRRFVPERNNRFSTYAYCWMRERVFVELAFRLHQRRYDKPKPGPVDPRLHRARPIPKHVPLDALSANTIELRDRRPSGTVMVENRDEVDFLLSRLQDRRHREALERRFGLAGHTPQTPDEVAKSMGVDRRHVQFLYRWGRQELEIHLGLRPPRASRARRSA